MKPDRKYFLLFEMTRVSNAEDYAVYQIDFGSSPEPKKSGNDQFFVKLFGKKLNSQKEMNYINSIRQVFKLMFICSSLLIGR